MKTLLLFLITIAIAAYMSPFHQKRAATEKGKGFAVIELFTSEGCSSCPPADALIEKIQQQHAGQPVYILAFHVDYWNHLGWRDVFSDAMYTDRQKRYADWLNVGSIYTPQLVVNGTSEYVGSDEGSITQAIDAALTPAATSGLTLQATVANDQINIQYQAPIDQQNELVLALVQKAGHSRVRAGENAGRQLAHVQIVRKLLYVNIAQQKNVTMATPVGFNTRDWELIGFVQNKKNGQIIAAGRTAIQQ